MVKLLLFVKKQNKQLKSVPSKIKKEPYYLALKQAKNEFIDQYRRSKIMFEQAMENSTLFWQMKSLCSIKILY